MASSEECVGCGKKNAELKRCGRCKEIKYCSRECQVNDWRMHKLACSPVTMGHDIDNDLTEFSARWTKKWSSWDSSKDPYDMAEMEEKEQKRVVSKNPWPSEHEVVQYMKTNWISQIHKSYGIDDGVQYYNHHLGKELYNAAGVSDRVKQMVAFRRVGWKIKLHGDSLVRAGNIDVVMRCMRVHYYLLEQIIQGSLLKNPPSIPFSTNLNLAWDGIGPWRA